MPSQKRQAAAGSTKEKAKLNTLEKRQQFRDMRVVRHERMMFPPSLLFLPFEKRKIHNPKSIEALRSIAQVAAHNMPPLAANLACFVRLLACRPRKDADEVAVLRSGSTVARLGPCQELCRGEMFLRAALNWAERVQHRDLIKTGGSPPALTLTPNPQP